MKIEWIKIKEFVIKARYVIGGLILGYIPRELEQTSFILNLENHTFWSGLAIGTFLGMRIIGVCIFAYGIAYYAEKTFSLKDKKITKREHSNKEFTRSY